MNNWYLLCLLVICGNISAAPIVYPKDKYGTELKHKGGYVVNKDGSKTAVDFVGNRQPHKRVVICVKGSNGKTVCDE